MFKLQMGTIWGSTTRTESLILWHFLKLVHFRGGPGAFVYQSKNIEGEYCILIPWNLKEVVNGELHLDMNCWTQGLSLMCTIIGGSSKWNKSIIRSMYIICISLYVFTTHTLNKNAILTNWEWKLRQHVGTLNREGLYCFLIRKTKWSVGLMGFRSAFLLNLLFQQYKAIN